MNCPNCAHEVNAEAAFCKNCGVALKNNTPHPQSTPLPSGEGASVHTNTGEPFRAPAPQAPLQAQNEYPAPPQAQPLSVGEILLVLLLGAVPVLGTVALAGFAFLGTSPRYKALARGLLLAKVILLAGFFLFFIFMFIGLL